MIRRTPGSTRTHTLFPYTTLFRACGQSFWTGAEGLMMMVSAARIDLSQAGMEQDFPFSPEWQTAATRVAARVVVICRSDQIDWNSFIKVEIGVIRRPGLDASHAVPSLIGLRRDGSFEQFMSFAGASGDRKSVV